MTNKNYITETKNQFQDKIIVITGSTQGIGAETAKLFASRGAKGITICGRNENHGFKVKEEIEKILSEANQPIHEPEPGDPNRKSTTTTELVQEMGAKGKPQEVNIQQNAYAYDSTYDEEDRRGPLEANEPAAFLYDEWDFRAEDYKPSWCVVRQKTMGEGESQFYSDTLYNYIKRYLV